MGGGTRVTGSAGGRGRECRDDDLWAKLDSAVCGKWQGGSRVGRSHGTTWMAPSDDRAVHWAQVHGAHAGERLGGHWWTRMNHHVHRVLIRRQFSA